MRVHWPARRYRQTRVQTASDVATLHAMRGLEIILPWLANAAGVLALVLLPWGWRGRRVSDHPHCRRCGFDLFGLPKTSHQCSECGADLDQRKAIRDGWRERHRGLVPAGWLLLLACGGFWGYTTTQRLRNLPAAEKPTWWLLVNAKSKTPAVEQAAMAELMVRHGKHVLTPKQTAEFLDRLLDMQGRPGVKWSREQSQAMEDARLFGGLSDDKWHRYLRQTPQFTFQLRSRIRQLDPLPFQIDMDGRRGGLVRVSDITISRIEVSGVQCSVPTELDTYFDRVGGRRATSCGAIRLPQDVFARLSSGVNKLTVWLDVDFYGGAEKRNSYRASIPVETQFTLVPAGMQAVKLRVPAEHQAAMRAALNIRRTGTARRPQITIEAKSTPLPIAAQVWIRSNGRERFVGTLFNYSDWTRLYTSVCDLTGFDSDYVDIVLRPDPELTIETIGITEIWGQEIILEQVRVR